jgi:hypothetical protein
MATNDTLPQQIKDGDDWFLGFASRLDPGNLPEKMLQTSRNMRLQRGTATIRKGAKRLNGFIQDNRIPDLRSTTVYTDPDTGEDFILMVLGGGMMLCYQDGTVYKYINFTYSANVNPVGFTSPEINIGTETQAIQALNKVYILRGSATTPVAAVTFTNAKIDKNTWGTFTVIGFPWRKFLALPYVTDTDAGTVTITIPRDHGFQIGDVLEVFSPVQFSTTITAITNTTIVVDYKPALPVFPGNISFMLYTDVYGTELIIQSTHDARFNGTYPVQNPATILTTGNVVLHKYNNSGNNNSDIT